MFALLVYYLNIFQLFHRFHEYTKSNANAVQTLNLSSSCTTFLKHTSSNGLQYCSLESYHLVHVTKLNGTLYFSPVIPSSTSTTTLTGPLQSHTICCKWHLVLLLSHIICSKHTMAHCTSFQSHISLESVNTWHTLLNAQYLTNGS
jgi:enamine deaminase RidA (YjgF/YER057c/UK114 family)